MVLEERPTIDHPGKLIPKVKNSGLTLALHLSEIGGLQMLAGKVTNIRQAPDNGTDSAIDLGAGQTTTFLLYLDDGFRERFFTETDLKDLKTNGGPRLHMASTLTYDDVFGKPRVTTICASYPFRHPYEPNDSVWSLDGDCDQVK